MAGTSKRRRMIGIAVAGILAATGAALLFDSYVLGRPTPEAVRTALAKRYPDLQDASITGLKSGFSVGDCDCSFVFKGGKWHGTWYRSLPPGDNYKVWDKGTLERAPFGSWHVIDAERCVQPAPGSIMP